MNELNVKHNIPLAPIAIFAYNRPDHLKKTIESLQKNTLTSESDLIVFSDGSKNNIDIERVGSVRTYLKTIKGFKTIHIVERKKNLGLAQSIIEGVSSVVANYGKIIVLEDDMITSPFFLTYMNKSLDLYESDENVASIHGYVYPIKNELPETFFIKGADCWGWATWKRGWSMFEHDGKKLLQELKSKKLTYEFDFYGTYPYTQMLEDQIRGKNNSWAIRWYASAFLARTYTLYPGVSLVKNIGMDASGTHSDSTTSYNVELGEKEVALTIQPVEESVVAKKAFADYFKKNRYGSVWKKIKYKIKKLLYV